MGKVNWRATFRCLLYVPQIAVPNENCVPFNYDLQRQHVVFCGTEILQGKTQGGDFCKAVVIRTGDQSFDGYSIFLGYSIAAPS